VKCPVIELAVVKAATCLAPVLIRPGRQIGKQLPERRHAGQPHHRVLVANEQNGASISKEREVPRRGEALNGLEVLISSNRRARLHPA